MACSYSNFMETEKYHNNLFISQEQIDARRNPLSKQQEVVKKLEFKKYNPENHIPDLIYQLEYYKSDEEPTPFYCGITRKDRVGIREQEHMDGVANPANLKQAYCFGREMQDLGYKVRFVVIGPAEDATETEVLQAMVECGYPMQNVGTTIDNRRKKRNVVEIAAAMKPKTSEGFKTLMKSPLTFVKSR